MRTPWVNLALTVAALMLAAPSLPAQDGGKSDLKSDLVRELKYAERRAVGIAEAVPAEKYSWRPMEGVASFSEVLMHLVTNKHFLLGMTGVPAPEGLGPDQVKQITDKDKIVPLLKEAYAKAINTIEESDPADWDREVRFFWKPARVGTVYNRLVIHSHEHVGQLIAYARMNQIVPPWSK
jgi:uncharacterized damage-inducible protein DinB